MIKPTCLLGLKMLRHKELPTDKAMTTTTVTLLKNDLAAITLADPKYRFDGVDELMFTFNADGYVIDCKGLVVGSPVLGEFSLARACRAALARYEAQRCGHKCQIIAFPTKRIRP
jgi:hypothetical protein